jgi:hypothetical protein
MASLLAILKTSSPRVGDKLQIDTSSINKHIGIQKVLNMHTRGIVYMRQYFKLSLEHATLSCECTDCFEGFFSPYGIPLDAYKEKSGMPFPIPQPLPDTDLTGDLRYMTLVDAMKIPFTTEHQPSLELRRVRNHNTTPHDGVALTGQKRITVNVTNENKKCTVNHACESSGMQRLYEASLLVLARRIQSNEANNWH